MNKFSILLIASLCLIALQRSSEVNLSRIIPHPIGVNVHFLAPAQGEMEMLKNMSVTYIRMDFIWAEVERSKGQYNFQNYDIFMSNCFKYGLIPYMIFDYTNEFYDQNLSPYTDEGREGFANFALAAVTRYKGKNVIWEIYNEPNLNQFWKPAKNVTNYCKLAHKVLDTIKTRYPGEIVVGPASSGIDMTFLEEVFKSGLLEKFDAISVHPYGNTPPEEAAHKYDELRKLMKQYGTAKDILSGEWGFHTVKHSEKEQAEFISRQWATNTMKDIPISIWYDFHDGS